ncbi:hypothetical protein [Paraflavitalea pollutisoli]|uniref:hypothetical protein n=1 Tax=Paraflavitalea pollutisoli TaxID=3034143 RepID=UPI0023EC61F5|nr:hypothetical protein [Paraflavitalea sp. H1-2-19X]
MRKQIPVLFSTPMVQAVYPREAKTQTRRTSGLDRINENPDLWEFERFEENVKGGLNAVFRPKGGFSLDPDWRESVPCRYGRKGDMLWVRETWRKYYKVDEAGYTQLDEEIFDYAADGDHIPLPMVDGDGFTMYDKKGNERYIPWRPNIHMPKVRARIWLEVTDIRVERLQDISEEDAKAEGVDRVYQDSDGNFWYEASDFLREDTELRTYKDGFKQIWYMINGKKSWTANPWVWVVSFRVLSTTGKPAGLEKEVGA